MDNKSVIEKAAFNLAALSGGTNGGLQNATQFSNFVRMIMNQPTILNDARIMPLVNDRLIVDRIGFGSRILAPGVEGTVSGTQVAPTTSKVVMATKEVIAETFLTYNMLENNIEHDQIQDTVMAMLAQKAAVDLEELILNGDTASGDAYLAMFDGLRKKAVTNVVDFAAAALDKTAFFKAQKAMPQQYLRDKSALKYYASQATSLNWEDSLAARQTPGGDNVILTGNAPTAYGIKIQPVATMKSYTNSAKQCSDIILTAPQNIILGMNRNIRIEVFHDTRARQFVITLSAKIAVDFMWEDAVVKVINVAE